MSYRPKLRRRAPGLVVGAVLLAVAPPSASAAPGSAVHVSSVRVQGASAVRPVPLGIDSPALCKALGLCH